MIEVHQLELKNPKFKVGFTGAHGTGKTTAMYALAYNMKLTEKDSKISMVTEVSRTSPFDINKNATYEGQSWIMSKMVNNELTSSQNADIIICDRTVIDVMAYNHLSDDSDKLIKTWLMFFLNYVKTYDAIVFNTIDNNQYLIDDGVRDVDFHYQRQIENKIRLLIDDALAFWKDDLHIIYD